MRKYHGGTFEPFGTKYQVGDVVGCFIDLIDSTISKLMVWNDNVSLFVTGLFLLKLSGEKQCFVRV